MEFKKIEEKDANFIIVGGLLVVGGLIAAVVC